MSSTGQVESTVRWWYCGVALQCVAAMDGWDVVMTGLAVTWLPGYSGQIRHRGTWNTWAVDKVGLRQVVRV